MEGSVQNRYFCVDIPDQEALYNGCSKPDEMHYLWENIPLTDRETQDLR